MPSPTRTEMRALAMRRSGHHAVLNWILRQVRGPGRFLNDCRLDPEGNVVGNRFSRTVNPAGDGVPDDLCLCNFEDLGVEELAALLGRARSRGSERVLHLLVVRDPFNWVASRLKAEPGLPLAGLVERWKGHVRECLGRTRIFPDAVPVDFRRWVADAAYRAGLATALGLDFDDRGFREVELPGLSSFDTGRVQEDNSVVLERWKDFRGDEAWRAALDAEVIELAEAFFGFTPLRDGQAGGA
ncbi:MAG: hypothetical protein ACJ759_16170 [Thermoanaerobaculia bacterium]